MQNQLVLKVNLGIQVYKKYLHWAPKSVRYYLHWAIWTPRVIQNPRGRKGFCSVCLPRQFTAASASGLLCEGFKGRYGYLKFRECALFQTGGAAWSSKNRIHLDLLAAILYPSPRLNPCDLQHTPSQWLSSWRSGSFPLFQGATHVP